MSQEPFNRCTHTALSPKGDLYVSDGYGNARVHKYSPDGKLLFSWGEPGTEPGQFNLPHNICCDDDGWVYVADRESHRVQVFDGNGRYETQWNNLHRPSGLYMPPGKCPICYIGECGPVMGVNRASPNLGPRVSIVDNKGKLLARFGDVTGAGNAPGPVHLAARHRGRLARRRVRRRSVGDRVAAAQARRAGARAAAFAAQDDEALARRSSRAARDRCARRFRRAS